MTTHRQQYSDLLDAEIAPHNERFRAAAGIRPGERVLDIGCGTGQSTIEAARAAAPGGSVLGADLSEPMIEYARERAAAAGLGNDVAHTGAWILPDERPLPADLEAFLDAGEPPVYVGFGSMRTTTGDTGHAAIEAVRAQGRRVLLARGWAGLALLDDRDDCFAVGEINQQALFGRVAVVVHHGGAGTTTTAARAGAPQVVVPQAGGDQPYWARRVAQLGIGAAHDGPAPTVESLSAALEVALSPGTRARAAAVAGQVRTDGADEAAKLLREAFS